MARHDHHADLPPRTPQVPDYDRIARRIGVKLREIYQSPEAEPLPMEHVDLLLRLRHKERDQLRSHSA